MRQLLDRLDNSATGECAEEFNIPVPDWKMKEAEHMAALCGDSMYKKYNVHEGVSCCNQAGLVQMYLNNVWNANLSITGADGLPPVAIAGNVVRSGTTVRCSMRLPPGLDPIKATADIKAKLAKDVPYNAKVTIGDGHAGSGWCMKELKPWLHNALQQGTVYLLTISYYMGSGYGCKDSNVTLLSHGECFF